MHTPWWAIAFVLLAGCGASLPPSMAHPLLQKPLPAHKALALSGDLETMPARGQVTVIDVWSTSCKPCLEMMPDLQSLWQREQGQGLRVIGIATDDNPGLVVETVKRMGLSYPQVVDADGSLRGWLQVDKIPATVVVDRQGQVRWFHRGNGAGDTAKLKQVVLALEGER